jgi:phosphomannomutase
LSEPIISVSGLRGIVGESLTPEVVRRYVGSFALELPLGPVVIGRDGRASGPEISRVVAETLVACGREVLDADVAATPTIGVLVREHKAAGGVQISASHNPAEYNGLKLFGEDGRVIPAVRGERVLANYRAGKSTAAQSSISSAVIDIEDTTTTHLRLIRQVVNFDAVQARKFRVLLDANRGSGSVLGVPLLQALGCKGITLGETPDGIFEHLPEPTAENLRGVASQVASGGYDVGFCQDPDADRLALIDERGRYIGEELTLAICVEHQLRHAVGPIVTNCSTSRVNQDLAERAGAPFSTSAVGEANVVDEMLRVGAVLGGEGNGGVIHPRVGFVRDSFVGMAMVLAALAERGLPLSAVADALPKYALFKGKVALSRERLEGAMAGLIAGFPEGRASRPDGVRLDFTDGWLLVRGSNTEPIVRIFAEAPTAELAAQRGARAIELLGNA